MKKTVDHTLTEHFQGNNDKADTLLSITCLLAPLAASFALIFLPIVVSKMLTPSLNRSLGTLLMGSIYGGFLLPVAGMLLVLGRMRGGVSGKVHADLRSTLIGCLIDIVTLGCFVWWMKINNLGL